jgi:hypothetical protein
MPDVGATALKPTIVLVQGASADATSWNSAIERLQQQGTAWSLRSIHRAGWWDTAFLATVVNQMDGPVRLAGHSQGGADQGRHRRPNLVGLVLVASGKR